MRQDGGVSSSDSVFRIAVLASGGGTNLQAIIDRLHGSDGIEVAGVGSDKPDAFALERARSVLIETAIFPREDYPDRDTRDDAMADWIDSLDAEAFAVYAQHYNDINKDGSVNGADLSKMLGGGQ